MRLQCQWLLVVTTVVIVSEVSMTTNRRRNNHNARARSSTSDGGNTNGGDNFDGNIFLENFGYLDDMPDHNHDPASIRQALTEYQRFNGLRVTGRLDRRTVRMMQRPRCGMPDVIKPGHRPSNLRNNNSPNAPLAYNAPGYKWENNDVTYKIMGYTRQLGGTQQRSAIASAFRKWSDVTPLNFRRSSGRADIEISFDRREHGDGYGNAFDGRGNTLAHAFFPGVQPIAGDTHFDDDERWTMGTSQGTNLEIVAAHEFGHAIGLGHSSNPQALMAPIYRYEENYGLHSDDIRGAQSLYGSGGRTGTRTPRPTRAPRPTARPTRPTRPRPTPSPGGNCALKFDAIDQLHDGRIYAFRGNQVYLMTSNGPSNRRRTRSMFPGAPNSPGAVVYDRYRRKLYFFKGRKYWRYTGFRKDAGYPRNLPNDFRGIKAAMMWQDGGIYVFKGRQYARWTEGLRSYPSGYPRRASEYWRGMPINMDASFRSYDGYYYIFKGQRYWRFNSRATLSAGYPKDMRPIWLNCRRPSSLRANALELSYLTPNIRQGETTD